ncbi:MAG: KTSC domain-containing protein [Limisphaerales bacterium]
MKHIFINSSCIRSFHYKPKSRRLELKYTNRNSYEYLDIPVSKYKAFLKTESKGEFVNKEIKKHPYRKMPD